MKITTTIIFNILIVFGLSLSTASLVFSQTTESYAIVGSAKLEGQTYHSGIKVICENIGPGFRTTFYGSVTIGSRIYQMASSISNVYTQGVTLTRVEIYNQYNQLTAQSSDPAILNNNYLGPNTSVGISISPGIAPVESDAALWTTKWYCSYNGNNFTITSQYGSSGTAASIASIAPSDEKNTAAGDNKIVSLGVGIIKSSAYPAQKTAAVAETLVTDNAGQYMKTLPKGVYTLTFLKPGFTQQVIAKELIYFNKTMNSITLPPTPPALSLSSASMQLGAVKLNNFKDTILSVGNTGGGVLTISAISSTNSVFTSGSVKKSMAAGETTTDTIRFTPTAFGTVTGRIILTSNDPTGPDTIVVQGTSPYPQISLSSASLNYGDLAVGQKKYQTVRISNSSINTLAIDSLYFRSSVFSSNKIKLSIAAMDSIIIGFAPSAFGTCTDTLYLLNNSFSSMAKIVLTGVSPLPMIACNKEEIVFGDRPVGSTMKLPVTISNASVNILLADSIYTKTSAFTVDRTALTIAATAELTVNFSPTAFGSYLDTLYVKNNSAAGLVKIPLKGNSPLPTISLNRSNVDFGDKAAGSSTAMAISITNTSINLLKLDSIYTKTSVFTVNKTALTVAGSDSISISFMPVSPGKFADTLFIISNGGTLRIPLAGTSPYPACRPQVALMDFGSVMNTKYSTKEIVLTNGSLNKLTIDSVSVKTRQFTLGRSAFPIVVGMNDTVKLAITFAPDSIRTFTDTLIVYTNAQSPTLKIPLSGKGEKLTNVERFADGIPGRYTLSQNYPNPFNPATLIAFGLPEKSDVTIKVYDITGREVATLIDGATAAGYYSIRYNASGLTSGVYLYRLTARNAGAAYSETKRFILLK